MKGIKSKSDDPVKLALAAIAAAGGLYLVVFQYGRLQTDDFRNRLARSAQFAQPQRRVAVFLKAKVDHKRSR